MVIDFHWICSIMKVYFICCVPAQNLYLVKSCCSKRIGQNDLSQSDCKIFKGTIFSEQIDEMFSFCACWCKFKMYMIQNEKIIENFLVGHGQKYLLTVSQKWKNKTQWFFTS